MLLESESTEGSGEYWLCELRCEGLERVEADCICEEAEEIFNDWEGLACTSKKDEGNVPSGRSCGGKSLSMRKKTTACSSKN